MTPSRPPSAAAGLTLVELLAVVVIMAILASTAVSAASDGTEQKLKLTEIQLRDAMERAQALAISTRSPHGVAFDIAGDRLAIVDESGDIIRDTLTKRDYLIDFHKPGQVKVDIKVADFGSSGPVLVFDPQGVPLTGGTIRIERFGETRLMVLDPATGRLLGPD